MQRIYESINVFKTDQLNLEIISSLLNLNLHYWSYESAIAERNNTIFVFINNNQSLQRQWQDFGHEAKHLFFDVGDKKHLKKSFMLYQEVKADYFAYHFCIPTFMLAKLKGVTVYDVMNLFNVEFDFALKRIEMYKNNAIVAAESRTLYRMKKGGIL